MTTASTSRQTSRQPGRILLLGGTSEIGLAILAALGAPPETEVLLAGRDKAALEAAGKTLPYQIRTFRYDATETAAHEDLIRDVFAGGRVDVVISAAGVLIPQPTLDQDPQQAAVLIDTNFTSHVTTLLATVARMRAQGSGTIVVLSSVAAIRPRTANMVYGAAKAGLDAFARGLADSLHGTGIRVLLIRPGFVTGRMTAGMDPAPLATTPAAVGAAVAAALARDPGRDSRAVWVPQKLAGLASAMRLVPRPLWRRLSR